MKLTKLELQGVRNWLKFPRKDAFQVCPFWNEGIVLYRSCRVLCPSIFPSLQRKREELVNDTFFPNPCPCTNYPYNYVVRVARLLIGRKGVTR